MWRASRELRRRSDAGRDRRREFTLFWIGSARRGFNRFFGNALLLDNGFPCS
jgi:hypothetical protein